MAKELVFYTNPMSRGRIVRWMLEEVGTPYQTKVLEYGPPMKTAEFLGVNPMGKVPAIRHGDAVVTETAAILAYLADAFPEAGLAPVPAERADYYRWLFFVAGPVEAAVADKMLEVKIPSDKEGFIGYGNYDLVMNTLAAMLKDRNYIAGNKFSAADIYVGSHLSWGMQFGTVPDREEFKQYWARLSRRDAYRRATDMDDQLHQAA